MNRKRIYVFSLFSFLLVCGLFGFTAVSPAREPVLQSTPRPAEASAAPTSPGQLPVTGERAPLWTEILLFYGLIALTALFLLLVLLNTVHKSMIAHAQRKESSPEEIRKP